MWKAVDALLKQTVDRNICPGCAMAAGQGRNVLYTNVTGLLVRDGERKVSHTTLYDVGALTQAMVTMPLCMLAVEKGLASPDDPIGVFLPDVPSDKKGVTLMHLLTHTSGLSPHFQLHEEAKSDRDALKALLKHPLSGAVGAKVKDSDMGFLLLGLILETIFAMPLDEAVKRYVTAPLHMSRTGFLPSGADVAPTAIQDENGQAQAGFPLDGNARFLHGVAGHAGLFTNLEDATRFASMLACQGETEEGVFLSQRAVHLATTDRTRGMNEARGYGLRITKRSNPFLGLLWPSDGFGLTDVSGGSAIAVSPEDGFFVTVLLNAGNPLAMRQEGERALKLLLNAAYAAFQREVYQLA